IYWDDSCADAHGNTASARADDFAIPLRRKPSRVFSRCEQGVKYRLRHESAEACSENLRAFEAEDAFAPLIGIDDFASGGIAQVSRLRQMFEKTAVFEFRLPEVLLSAICRGAEFLFLDGLHHCGPETPQPVLQQIVVGAILDRVDGGFFADRSGHDDEWNIQLPLLQQLKCLERAEAGQRVVA